MTITAGQFETADKWTSVDFPKLNSSKAPVVIGSINTFIGNNTAGLRMKNVQADSMEAFVEEEKSKDQEKSHIKEVIRFIGATAGPIHDASGSTIGEVDAVELDQPNREQWHTVSLTESYNDPVIFMQIMSYKGSQACHTRVRNVKADNFEFQIEEWSTYDGKHVKEKVGYIVLEQGLHELSDGTPLEVQKMSANHKWTNVDFKSEFGREPAVVSQCQTLNDPTEVVTRHRNLYSQGIDVRLQEEEVLDGVHNNETIGVLTMPRQDVDIGLDRVEGVSHLWKAFKFESRIDPSPVVLATIETFSGTNPVAPRIRNVSPFGAEVFVEEETSTDEEMEHKKETVSVVVASSGRLADNNGNIIGEAGTMQTNQPGRGHWHSINFHERYSEPVVFMQIMSYNGTHPSHIRLRNVNSGSCEFQIEEWAYLDGEHTEETIGYLVVEKGTHELFDGSKLQAGKTQSNHEWSKGISFAPDFKNKQPVFLSQCQTRNENHEVVTRTNNLDAHGFEVRLQEEQGRDVEHTGETIGFLGVARPGHTVPNLQGEGVPEVKVGNFHPETCGFHFKNKFPSGQYTLPHPIWIGPIIIKEIGDTSNGMCGGMAVAARDYYEYGCSPWPEDLLDRQPANSPVNNNVPAEDTDLFNFLSERLFDSFKPGLPNIEGATKYWKLMNAKNTGTPIFKKSRNQVMKDQWETIIKPTLDNDTLCPLGLVQVDTHDGFFNTGLKPEKLGDNHQVLAYGYTERGSIIEIYVYDPNDPGNGEIRIQFELKDDLRNWFNPTYISPNDLPLYAFFAVAYQKKKPPFCN